MTFWILPWNKEVYDLPQCLEDFGFVEWRQKNKLAVDDIVYLYCSTPVKQIMYMMRVSKINISKEDSINDEYLYNYRYPIKETDFYTRLEPIAKAQDNNPELSYSKLQKLGIKSQIQGGIRVPEILLSHLLKNFNAVYDDLTQSFIEGY